MYWLQQRMDRAVDAMIDGSSHINDIFEFFSTLTFSFLPFYINHNLPFMNDNKGFVPLFTRVLSSISCL